MELKSKTFWEMEKESISYLHHNESSWIQQAVLNAVVADLERNENELELAFKAQDANNPGGQVAQKNGLLGTFFHNIYRLGRKLSFYAKDNGDKVLLNDAAISESGLQKLPEKEALIKSSNIIRLGNEYLEKAAGYGITAEEIDGLTRVLSELETMQPTIGVITNDRKSARHSIETLTNQARTLLDKLDDGLEGLIDNDDFINGWFTVRKIKGRHIYKSVITP